MFISEILARKFCLFLLVFLRGKFEEINISCGEQSKNTHLKLKPLFSFISDSPFGFPVFDTIRHSTSVRTLFKKCDGFFSIPFISLFFSFKHTCFTTASFGGHENSYY